MKYLTLSDKDGNEYLVKATSARSMTRKFCPKCEKFMLMSNFYKNSNHIDGRQGRCKKCSAKYQNAGRERLRDELAAMRGQK